jgi:phosphate-selective porin OprO/OprP
MKMKKATLLALALAAQGLAMPLRADDTNTLEIIKQLQRRIDELEQKVRTLEQSKAPVVVTNDSKVNQRIEALDQQLKELERERQEEDAAAAARAKVAPKITLGSDGFLFNSADDDFKLKIRGYIQADGRFYLNDTKDTATDTFLLNRVRPVFEGTVFHNFDFKLMPDFGQGKAVIQDAFLDAHFLPWLSVRVGKFKGPVGLERLQSARDLQFVERALPIDLVPNRDIGVALHGEFFGGVLGYEAGVFNGSIDGNSNDVDENDEKDFEGRLFLQPFKQSQMAPLRGLGIGVAGTFGVQNGAPPSYKTVGQETFFSLNAGVAAVGDRSRVAPQGYYYWGPFGLMVEYVANSQGLQKGAVITQLRSSAWQVQGALVLTGEKASYTGVAPLKPFAPGQGQWGAFELVGRITQLEVGDGVFHNFGTAASPNTFADRSKSASQATDWGVGLNWYLNKSVKWMLDYDQTHFRGGAPTGNRAAEQIIFSRVQIAF